MKRDRDVLADHGTELMRIKPASILQAARADLKRRTRNSQIGNARAGNTMTDAYEPYAFHRLHVRRAVDERDLLLKAVMDAAPGLQSDKRNTRLLYGNASLLLAALDIASRESGVQHEG